MSAFDDQLPFIWTEFAENPEPRCPCLLLLDASGATMYDRSGEYGPSVLESWRAERGVKRLFGGRKGAGLRLQPRHRTPKWVRIRIGR